MDLTELEMCYRQTDQLAELIGRKHECLARLHLLGRKQLGLVEEGRMAELLDLLAVKHRLLLELQELDRQLDPFRQDDPEQRHWRSTELRQQCADRADQCRRLLQEVLAQEKECEQKVIRRREETAAQLERLSRSGQACGAYLSSDRAARNPSQIVSEG